MLEEYLLALILQSNDIKQLIIKTKDILVSYSFETPAVGKIFAEIIRL